MPVEAFRAACLPAFPPEQQIFLKFTSRICVDEGGGQNILHHHRESDKYSRLKADTVIITDNEMEHLNCESLTEMLLVECV